MYTYIKTNENGQNLECFASSEIKPSYNPTAKEKECDEYKDNYDKWEKSLELIPFADDIQLTNVYQRACSDYNKIYNGNFSDELKSYFKVDCIKIENMSNGSKIEYNNENIPTAFVFKFKKLAFYNPNSENYLVDNKSTKESENRIEFISHWNIEQAATKYIQSYPEKSSWRAYVKGASDLKDIYEKEIIRLSEELKIRSHELHMSNVKILDKSKEYRDNISKLKEELELYKKGLNNNGKTN